MGPAYGPPNARGHFCDSFRDGSSTPRDAPPTAQSVWHKYDKVNVWCTARRRERPSLPSSHTSHVEAHLRCTARRRERPNVQSTHTSQVAEHPPGRHPGSQPGNPGIPERSPATVLAVHYQILCRTLPFSGPPTVPPRPGSHLRQLQRLELHPAAEHPRHRKICGINTTKSMSGARRVDESDPMCNVHTPATSKRT